MTPSHADLQAALDRLPHGPEFRFLDRLTYLEPGRQGEATYLVRGDELFLRGHFPGQPLFPGVLLLEAAAQLSGVVAQSDPAIPPLEQLKLTALRAVKILGSARPGETLQLQARVTARLGNLVQATAQIFVMGQVILNAELTLSGANQSEPNNE